MVQEEEVAKALRSKFGIRKNSKKWKWNRVVNSDFSGLFTLQGFQNRRNDGVWAREGEEIEASLINAQTDKFRKGILFWGAISSQGLIPSRAPINVTQWLEQQRTSSSDKRKRVYLTNQLYAKFLTEKAAPAINDVFRQTTLIPIFHDDQDQKQRTILVRDTVAELFSERIETADGDAKFADVWRIENVCGALKEKLRGKVFSTVFELEQEIEKEWRKFSKEKCEKMMDEIPYRLQLVIDNGGEHVHKH